MTIYVTMMTDVVMRGRGQPSHVGRDRLWPKHAGCMTVMDVDLDRVLLCVTFYFVLPQFFPKGNTI